MSRRLLLLLSLLFVANLASAEELPRAFRRGSMKSIWSVPRERPLVVAFWSIDCLHCPTELAHLAKARQRGADFDLVLVSTDRVEDAPLLAERAAQLGLAGVEQWVFAEAVAERLRHEIDPRWFGELPRTYLRGRDGKIEARSGVLSEEQLAQWIQNNKQRVSQ